MTILKPSFKPGDVIYCPQDNRIEVVKYIYNSDNIPYPISCWSGALYDYDEVYKHHIEEKFYGV